MLYIHMILDGVCATKNIWSEYVLVTFWLHFGYILVTFWLHFGYVYVLALMYCVCKEL
jgi:hypothetical protein